MKKLLDAIYGLALILIFGTALLADGLVATKEKCIEKMTLFGSLGKARHPVHFVLKTINNRHLHIRT